MAVKTAWFARTRRAGQGRRGRAGRTILAGAGSLELVERAEEEEEQDKACGAVETTDVLRGSGCRHRLSSCGSCSAAYRGEEQNSKGRAAQR